ncbi:hypothetical protein [Spirosoma sp. KNUC1025]|uniref:hypothetical protein n=1 Tax=Spirosoma sp. KNUC1025 TaxID=2894082 RepID=UPI001E5432C8|nr:hypothetical protein [Spirosoma sp. KNUC1025]UFH57573.1 hypothetical protein LN737_31195 [Spirosoma sp. KNUC1025]
MKFFVSALTLRFKLSTEVIEFSRLTYFYGQMGAGKSSIARLVDYCLGGKLDLTPAFQQEFVSAGLALTVNDKPVFIYRQRSSDRVEVSWGEPGIESSIVLPARAADGEVLAGTGVENLSDLIFYIAGITPPRVRKSKLSEDSELIRLSLRDYLWYCYLDQDTIDSAFFHLESEAHTQKRLKSRDVMRSILGYHQEAVAQLEAESLRVREAKNVLRSGAKLLKETLTNNDVTSKEDINEKVLLLTKNLNDVKNYITTLRADIQRANVSHIVDSLKEEARQLSKEVEETKEAIEAVNKLIDDNTTHLNEIKSLKIKYQRGLSARYVLSNVQFESCPRCTQTLPARPVDICPVCNQVEPSAESSKMDASLIQKDADSRISELSEIIGNYEQQVRRLYTYYDEQIAAKRLTDRKITDEMQRYDSAYLATVLEYERRSIEIEQRIKELTRSLQLFKRVDEQLARADQLEIKERNIREQLKEARVAAEKDVQNIRKLERYFLEYLIKAGVPGIRIEDKVQVSTSTFLPLVAPEGGEDVAVTSFSNLSSGGKKVLFKCCYALAIHRLAIETDASLPTFLIIDSPMKNISERENAEVFQQFHNLVYDLAANDLDQTQFIFIDKEYCEPEKSLNLSVATRHMTPDDSKYPPLIKYYRGH